MLATTQILVLGVLSAVLSATLACAPCSTADFPPALKPAISTKLEQLLWSHLELLSGLVGDIKVVVGLVLVLLKVILETLKGLGINVGSLLGIVSGCYDAAKNDPPLLRILNGLLRDLGKVLNAVLKLLSNLLGGLLG